MQFDLNPNKLKTFLATSRSGAVVTDSLGFVLYTNKTFSEQTGFAEKPLIGTSIDDLLVLNSNKLTIDHIIQELLDEKSWSGRISFKKNTNNDHFFWVTIYLASNGFFNSYLIWFIDRCRLDGYFDNRIQIIDILH